MAGLTVAGAGGWAALTGSEDGKSVAVEMATIAARGSSEGRRTVPVQDGVAVVDLFATWCAPCEEQMDTLSALHDEFGDRVAFVSVTNERFGSTFSRDDLRTWWDTHGGEWTLGHDPESNLMRTLGVDGLPYLAVTVDGAVTWSERGLTDRSTLRSRIEAALADE
ncbi:TlpA family protein disulfide reductase [Halostella salina]|uniref:TlpA family protein disulfide reductase n=1 Tax=Halostella salina TaxID=1547897 RepID=UPI001969E02F|nr:TlpA disulfide reductase family protein [Halostella salina]